MRVLIFGGLAALLGMSLWLTQSTFVPFVLDDGVSYAFCSAPFSWLFIDGAVAAGLIGSASVAVERWGLGAHPTWLPRARTIRLFAPLTLVGVNLVTLGLLWAPLSAWWAPMAYIAGSLHHLVCGVAFLLVVLNVNAAAGDRLSVLWRRFLGLDPANQMLLFDAAVVSAVLAVVITSSPGVRFSSAPIGDEPKYLRYAENWWQGRGMDMDGIQDVSTMARHDRPRLLRNLTLLGPAIRRDVAQLAADARFLRNRKHWGHRFNRAEYAGNWLLKGKNGGLYQMHAPGISFAILPAYAIDRWLFNRGFSRFADDLFAVNVTFLIIVVLLAGVLFRLIAHQIGDPMVAAVVAVGCLTSFPLAAFTFQFYPETLGALLVCFVAQRILGDEPLTARAAAMIALALAWLTWLHIRFIPVSIALFLWIAWTFRRKRGPLWTATTIYVMVSGAFCLYVYHVTGSLLPTALYEAAPTVTFEINRLPVGVLGTLFDRENGLLALAPLYLLALPGLGLLLRERPRSGLVVLTLILTLMVPVAGQGYETSGTSPLRYMVAVAPLLAVPVAVWVSAVRTRTIMLAGSAVLILASIHFAVIYNLRNDKTITQAVAHGISGWDISLLFPLVRIAAVTASGFDAWALRFWVVTAVVTAVGSGLFGLRSMNHARGRMPATAVVAGCFAAIGVAGCLAILAGGPRRERRLLQTPVAALTAWRASCGDAVGRIRIGTPPTNAPTR